MKPPTTEAMKTVLESSTSPVTAHQPSQDYTPTEAAAALTSPTSSKSQLSPVPATSSCASSPNLSKCLDVTYESREQGPGVSYKTRDGKEEWTPVVRKKQKARRHESSESDLIVMEAKWMSLAQGW